MLLTNQIARFFDHQFFLRECMNIVDFLLEDIHLGEVASETYFWLCPDILSHV